MQQLMWAIRGATTVDEDTVEHVNQRVQALVRAVLERNEIDHDDIVSIIFTATEDVVSTFPATAARAIGLGDVPLLCARELSVAGSTHHCVRVLVHAYTTRKRGELHHVSLEGARGLRDDLPV